MRSRPVLYYGSRRGELAPFLPLILLLDWEQITVLPRGYWFEHQITCIVLAVSNPMHCCFCRHLSTAIHRRLSLSRLRSRHHKGAPLNVVPRITLSTLQSFISL